MSDADPITTAFKPFGGRELDVLDAGTGVLRDVAELDELWRGLDVSAVLTDIDCYPGTQGTEALAEALGLLADVEQRFEIGDVQFVATHGAFDGLSHALAPLPGGAPVFFPMPGFDISAPVERAGKTPAPILWPVGAPMTELLATIEYALGEVRGPSAVVLNFPSNPAGTSPSVDEWDTLRELARSHSALVVVDAVYSFLETGPTLLGDETVVVVDSVSKRLGAPGLRLGFIMCQSRLLGAIRASAARTSVGIGRPTATIGAIAIQQYIQQNTAAAVRTELDRRRLELVAGLQPSLLEHLTLSDVGLYACIDVGSDCNAELAAQSLLDRGLRVTPGPRMLPQAAQGWSASFIRLCLGATDKLDFVVDALNDVVGPIATRTVSPRTPDTRPHPESRL